MTGRVTDGQITGSTLCRCQKCRAREYPFPRSRVHRSPMLMIVVSCFSKRHRDAELFVARLLRFYFDCNVFYYSLQKCFMPICISLLFFLPICCFQSYVCTHKNYTSPFYINYCTLCGYDALFIFILFYPFD